MDYRTDILRRLKDVDKQMVWFVLGESAFINNNVVERIKQFELDKSPLMKLFNKNNKGIIDIDWDDSEDEMEYAGNGILSFDKNRNGVGVGGNGGQDVGTGVGVGAAGADETGTTGADSSTGDSDSYEITGSTSGHVGTNGMPICSLEYALKRPASQLTGRWVCLVNYSNLRAHEREAVRNYSKNPCNNVLMIVLVEKYQDRIYVKNKCTWLKTSPLSHTLNSQFPTIDYTNSLIKQLFLEQHIKITENQLKLFNIKLGHAYDDYKRSVEQVAFSAGAGIDYAGEMELTDKDFKRASKNIDHFEITDLLRSLTKPFSTNMPLHGRREVHKQLAHLLKHLTAKEVCNKLRFKVIDMLAYRIAINDGIIPIKVPYSAPKAQNRLPENNLNSRPKRVLPYQFKRDAYIASRTSLGDWFYMYLLLETITSSSSDSDAEKVLLSIVNRSAISQDRLMNDIGVKNVLEEELFELNGIFYSPWFINLAGSHKEEQAPAENSEYAE